MSSFALRPAWWRAFAPVGALVLALAAESATAQEETLLQGVISDELTGAIISSATVSLEGTKLETRTTEEGIFTFANPPLGRIGVRVRARGYPDVIEEVEMAPGSIVIMQMMLPTVAVVLDGLVANAQPRRPLLQQTEGRTAVDLLAMQVQGIYLNQGAVRRNNVPIPLRGNNSITRTTEPVVYLDGVRLAGNFSDALNLLIKIPAAQVKEIEVLRGPSSAFLQGSATGAILVTTRSGAVETR